MAYRISYFLLEDGRGTLHVVEGRVPGDTLASVNARFHADFAGHVQSSEYWVSDYSGFDSSELSASHSREVAEFSVGMNKPDYAVAALVGRDLEFGMARMWESWAAETGWRMGIFREREKLRQWLGETLGREVSLDGGELVRRVEED